MDRNNGKSAERMMAKSTNRSRNSSDLPLRQPTEQKAEAASLFAHWLTEAERNLDFVTSTGYMPVRNGAFDFIDEAEFTNQGYAKLYAALKTMQETYTPLAEVRFTDYYSKVHALYDGLRQMQQELPRRAAAGEDVEALAEETWALFRSIR